MNFFQSLRFNCLVILIGFLSIYHAYGQDITPPSIASAVPSNNSTGLSINTTDGVTIAFSEPVEDPSGSVTINPSIAFTTSFDAGTPNKLAIIFTPEKLDFSTNYTITLTGVADKAATPNTADLSTSFTTEQAPAPAIASVTPLNGATGLSVSETNRVDFSFTQPIADPTGKITIDPAIGFTIDFSTSTTLGVIFTPATLGFSEEYTITLTGIEHEADVSSTADLSTNFTTEQGPAPSIKEVAPLNGATGLSVRTTNQVLITFEDGISQPTGGFAITIDPSIGFNTADFNFFNPFELPINLTNIEILEFNREYTITLNGIPSAVDPTSVSGPLTTSFTTGLAPSVNNALTENICIGDLAGTELSDIVITENLADNFISTSDDQEHRLILEVDDGFEFIEAGTIDLEDDTDISSESIEIVNTNSRRLLLKYKLCSGDPCTPSAIEEDIFTLKDIKVRTTATNTPVAGTTYEIKRVNAASNNAEIPGLGAGTVFAELEVVAGPDLAIFNSEGESLENDQTVRFCAESDISLRFAKPDNSELDPVDDEINILVNNILLEELDFPIEGNLISFNKSNIKQFLIDNSQTFSFPIQVKAELTSAGNTCTGFSNTINVDTFNITKQIPTVTMTNGINQGSKIVPRLNLESTIEVSPTGGKLDVRVNNTRVFA